MNAMNEPTFPRTTIVGTIPILRFGLSVPTPAPCSSSILPVAIAPHSVSLAKSTFVVSWCQRRSQPNLNEKGHFFRLNVGMQRLGEVDKTPRNRPKVGVKR